MFKRCALIGTILLAGCEGGGEGGYAPEAANATAPVEGETLPAMKAGDEERVVSGRTVEAVLDGFAPGEPLTAVLAVPAEGELRALVDAGREGLDHFLAANRGHSLRLRLATVQRYDAAANGTVGAQRILDAQNIESTADAWWETLGPDERVEAAAATRRLRAEAG
jgi:hypothetical protein